MRALDLAVLQAAATLVCLSVYITVSLVLGNFTSQHQATPKVS